jgi:hypothetical protein
MPPVMRAFLVFAASNTHLAAVDAQVVLQACLSSVPWSGVTQEEQPRRSRG